LLGTKVDATNRTKIKSLKPIAYYETLRKEVFNTGITRVDLAELICGQKLKRKRIAFKFLIFNSFVKPSHFLIKNKQDL